MQSGWQLFIGDHKDWNDFILSTKSHYRQLYEWGEYKSAIGWKVLRVVYSQKERIIASAQILYKRKLLINALYIPGGINGNISTLNQEFFDLLKKSLSTEIYYLRSDFTTEAQTDDLSILKQYGWSRPSYKVHSSQYCEIDLRLSNDELLSGAKQKWRYNHRKSLKNEIHLSEEKIPENFIDIHKELSDARKHGNFYTAKEVIPLIDNLGEKMLVSTAEDKHNNLTALRSVIIVGNKAWHNYSAVNKKGRDILSGYRLLIHMLDILRQRGIEYFNFGEMNEQRFPGPYRFKLGIGQKSKIYKSLGEWHISKPAFLATFIDIYVRLYLREHGYSIFSPKQKK